MLTIDGVSEEELPLHKVEIIISALSPELVDPLARESLQRAPCRRLVCEAGESFVNGSRARSWLLFSLSCLYKRGNFARTHDNALTSNLSKGSL